jgi:hypothetical protein
VLLALVITVSSCPAADPKKSSKSKKVEPLRTSWIDLVADEDLLKERRALTQLRNHQVIMKEVEKTRRDCRSKTFGLTLRVNAVIPPQEFTGRDLILVHGNYIDMEYQERFGKDATIGIWTRDRKTAESLAVGDHIELTGRVFHEVAYPASAVAKYRVKSEWKQKNINTSLALLRKDMTGFAYDVRVFMVNLKLKKVEAVPANSPSPSANKR